jgi:hypothetical protein
MFAKFVENFELGDPCFLSGARMANTSALRRHRNRARTFCVPSFAQREKGQENAAAGGAIGILIRTDCAPTSFLRPCFVPSLASEKGIPAPNPQGSGGTELGKQRIHYFETRKAAEVTVGGP